MIVPVRVIGLAAGILAEYYTHAELDRRFLLCGYEITPPEGSKIQKVTEWLRSGNNLLENHLTNFGELIEEFMEDERQERVLRIGSEEKELSVWRDQMTESLRKSGLNYENGKVRLDEEAGHVVDELKSAVSVSTGSDEASSVILAGQQDQEVKNKLPKSFSVLNLDVFLVHGHDRAQVQETARVIEKLGLTPIILAEQPNRGRTLMEKFEGESAVGFAVVLMTGDDMGGKRIQGGNENLGLRSRQNVILELGYFIGRLGREAVCVLKQKDVEEPSDIHGVVYTEIDSGGAWKFALCRELRAAGYDVDSNKL